ncbi:Nuclear nucleic acid-binding protein C1D [Grifola frondosa]|uniref:Exosome complex protein n=1 Tax=Grifola frondosa TaxID=5627 RepID=A0A1C7MSE5_GRIFR|nr:Nuclear nucleic acid-binding protein C1D [Grifola frondosa]
MLDDSDKLHAKLSALTDSLDDLEAKLDPLFAQTLPESVVGLETIQQAKLQVVLPYLVYDLIFIYLKTRGIDPKTHPVITELDRVRQYFEKIKDAENPAKRKVAVDKAVANRFIKHAIAQVQAQRPPGDNGGPSRIKFDEEGRVPVKELAEAESEEEEVLEIFEEKERSTEEEEALPEVLPTAKDKGKGRAIDIDDSSKVGVKRRRPAVDPFAGYGDEPMPDNSNSAAKPSKKRKFLSPSSAEIVALGDGAKGSNSEHDTPQSSDSKSKKSAKRAARKAKKKTL